MPSQSHPHPPDNDDPVAPDDAIIGRAFRWSLAVLGLLAAGTGIGMFIINSKPPPTPQKMTSRPIPVIKEQPKAEIPTVKFSQAGPSSGIHFVPYTGATGEKLLPETMGGGVAFFDFDNDGHQDLLLVNACAWPWNPAPEKPPTHALYHNDGQGHFQDVTAGSGLEVSFYGQGVAVGDYDNDGLPDVFITGVWTNRLFHNEGNGKFREVTVAAGLPASGSEWGTSAAFLDYDNDGRLDLFVCNYIQWSREIDSKVGYKIDGQTRAYGQPWNFGGAFCALYHNEGQGRFRDVSAEAGIQIRNPATKVPVGKSLGVAPIDLDGDGWIDLVVANDTVQNFVFHNQRNGTFKEIGEPSGIAFDSYGNARGAMGIDAGRFRNDAAIGIAIANFANEMTGLYVAADKPLFFSDESIVEGIGPESRLFLKFGLFFFDYDLDGRLDVLTANGHLENEITKIQHSQSYRQPAQLFWNAGPRAGGCFVPVPAEKAGADLFTPIVGRGSAFADIDGDGDLDVLLTQVGGPPLLLRNEQALKHNWLRLKLVGKKCNRDAIGAWIKVQCGGQNLWRQVMPTRGYLSQSELPVTIGLGTNQAPNSVEIHWPGGKVQKLSHIQLNQTTVITETE